MRRWLLRVPLFYKILLANAALVLLIAVAATLATASLLRTQPARSVAEVVAVVVLAGVAASVIVNALILRLALEPLDRLEDAAKRVQSGDLEARAPLSSLADRDLERLVLTFNGMLESIGAYRSRLREVAARALDAAEEERKRIARELHDGTAQALAALLVRLRLARRADAETRDALLEELGRDTSGAIEEVRRIAEGLRPPALDMLGLVPALEGLARSLAGTTALQIDVEAEPLDGLLTPDAELALYRVIQEALSNVVRHADARTVKVEIRRRDNAVLATIEDDGQGFDTAAVLAERGRGLGLFGMQERALYVGGRVEVRSRPGAGTRVQVEIPTAEGVTNG